MGNGFMVLTAGVSAIGGLLFGYDVGVIGGSMTIDSFKQVFPLDGQPLLKGFIVSSLTIGCFFGALSTSYLADRLGRKVSCICGAAVFTLGALLQTISHTYAVLIAGRVVAGLAIGMLSAIVPLYISEIAPKERRGAFVGTQQLTITIGILLSFLTNYGTSFLHGEKAFRIPFGIQMAFSATMFIGMLFMPRSPRWLVSRDRIAEAETALRKVRSVSDDVIMAELAEIQDAVRHEREIGHGSWPELVGGGMWRRVAIGVGLQMFQQLTGINVVMYYSNDILSSAGFTENSAKLLGTVATGAVNVLMTLPGMYFMDRVGRRLLLLTGDIVMAAALTVLAVLVAVYRPSGFSEAAVPWVCLVMMCIFTAGFAYSWGPICWVYPSEIFPQRIRAKSVALTTASNWLFNALIGLLSPVLMDSLVWGFYLILVGFLVIMCLWVFFFVPETKGRSLEEMDAVFGKKSSSQAREMEAKQQF